MNVRMYNFEKRKNSTKQPVVTDATMFSVTLKDSTSVLNPTLLFNPGNAGFTNPFNPSQFNYCHIPYFSRYYFVRDWRFLNGVWECDLSVDVLASFKAGIGLSTEYVTRSSYTSDGTIIDNMYPGTAHIEVDAESIPTIFKSQYSLGYFIVGIISNSSTATMGAVSYYQMTGQQIANLKSYMMSASFMTEQGLLDTSVTDVVPNSLLKTLYNPFQYIASCEWFPFDLSEIPSYAKTLVNNVEFGWWRPQSNISGYLVNPNVAIQTHSARYSIGGHPQRFERGIYMDQPPFCDRMLYIAPYGSIPLNDNSIHGGDFIKIQQDIDAVLGNAFLTVSHLRPITEQQFQDMGILYRTSTKISVPIQLSGSTIDFENALNAGIISAGGTLASGLAHSRGIAETFNATISAIGDSLKNPLTQLQVSGTNGSVSAFYQNNQLIQKFIYCADDDNEQKGRPLCRKVEIGTIPGYIVVDTPDVKIPCMDSELTEIKNYMSGGFFYE